MELGQSEVGVIGVHTQIGFEIGLITVLNDVRRCETGIGIVTGLTEVLCV